MYSNTSLLGGICGSSALRPSVPKDRTAGPRTRPVSMMAPPRLLHTSSALYSYSHKSCHHHVWTQGYTVRPARSPFCSAMVDASMSMVYKIPSYRILLLLKSVTLLPM